MRQLPVVLGVLHAQAGARPKPDGRDWGGPAGSKEVAKRRTEANWLELMERSRRIVAPRSFINKWLLCARTKSAELLNRRN